MRHTYHGQHGKQTSDTPWISPTCFGCRQNQLKFLVSLFNSEIPGKQHDLHQYLALCRCCRTVTNTPETENKRKTGIFCIYIYLRIYRIYAWKPTKTTNPPKNPQTMESILGFHTSEHCVQLSLVTFDSDLPTCASDLPRPTCLLSWTSFPAAVWQSSPISARSWAWWVDGKVKDVPRPTCAVLCQFTSWSKHMKSPKGSGQGCPTKK